MPYFGDMDKNNETESGPYIYEKPLKPNQPKKWTSGAVVAAGFVYLTSQLAGAGTSNTFTAAGEADLEISESQTQVDQVSSQSDAAQTQSGKSQKTSRLGTIQAFVKNPELGKLGKIESALNWDNNSAPTSASSGGSTPSQNISAPTGATTGGGTGSGTTPGNTTAPTGAAGGGDNDHEFEDNDDESEDNDDESEENDHDD